MGATPSDHEVEKPVAGYPATTGRKRPDEPYGGPSAVSIGTSRSSQVRASRGVGLSLRASSDPSDAELSTGEGTLVSGTTKNGVWRIPVDVPQGTPPGTYYSQVWLEDLTHWSSWASPGSPYADQMPTLTSTQAPGGALLTVQ